MRFLGRLTILYYLGFGLLAIIIMFAITSFQNIFMGIEEISVITQELFTKDVTLPPSEHQRLHSAFYEIEKAQLKVYLIFIIFIIALLMASLGSLLFIHIYRRKGIVEPLDRIISATKKIAEGKFEELPTMRGSEIGILMESFNFMSHALENKIKEFENTVTRERKVIRKLNILNELASSLIYSIELQAVLSTMMSSSLTLIKSEFGAIALCDPPTHKITHFHTSLSDEAENLKTLTEDLMREILDKGTTLRLRGAVGFKDLSSLKIRNLLALPIMIEGESRGILIAGNKFGVEGFTQDDEDTLLMLTFQSAVAIERAILQEKILHLGKKIDGLTKLNNHSTFHEVLGVEFEKARRYQKSLSLLMIDIDNLKRFNDICGYQAGDMALKEFADILTKNLRTTESTARYGGEKFSVILPETSVDAAVKIAERIREETFRYPFKCVDKEFSLTVSIGVSAFPEDSINKDGLIKAADDALYAAKRRGKNRVVTFKQHKAQG